MLLGTIQGKETLVLYIGHFDTCDRFEYPFIMGHSKKDPYSPHRGNFCHPEGEGRKNCF